jgi:hypothetical protein
MSPIIPLKTESTNYVVLNPNKKLPFQPLTSFKQPKSKMPGVAHSVSRYQSAAFGLALFPDPRTAGFSSGSKVEKLAATSPPSQVIYHERYVEK